MPSLDVVGLDPDTGRPPECARNKTLTDLYERLGAIDARLDRIEKSVADLSVLIANGFANLASRV